MHYETYKNLPPLAGLCRLDEAMLPGLSVESCVARLKRFYFVFKNLHQMFIARMTAEPIYELKMGFSLHSHYCIEHASSLRKRVGEMREPPLGLDKIPHPDLQRLIDEVMGTPTTEELLLGIYEVILPALKAGLIGHIRDTNHLVDQPSVRVCKFALLEIDEMINYGSECVTQLLLPDRRTETSGWVDYLHCLLASAGGLDGESESKPHNLAPCYSAKPFQYDSRPQRDERFQDPYNMGVNAEAFLYNEEFPPEPKTLMMFYKRLREIDVPEMMASIIHETKDKPWDYYRDLTRQLWDEARHAMMGEVGFINLGLDWRKVMVNFTWSFALNSQLKPIERHAVLYFIEQGLMSKTGKRFEWEVGLASKNPLAGLFQDYDWADEVLHAKIGRDWYVKQFSTPTEAVEYGDLCWSRVLLGWESWREEGLTTHRNWWPEVYTAACKQWGIAPDPKVLNYNTTYQTIRADLRNISVSA